MKRKIITVILIMSLLLGALFILTGCGEGKNEDEEDDNISSDDLAQEVVEDFWKYYEDCDAEKSDNCIDWAAYYTMDSIDNYDYENFYEEYEDYVDSREWKNKKEEIEEEREFYLESIEEDVCPNAKYKFDEINYVTKVSKNFYKVSVGVTFDYNHDGEEDPFTITFYVIINDDEAYIANDDAYIIDRFNDYLY